MVTAWLMDSSDEDQRAPHRREPNVEVSLEELKKVGCTYWRMNTEKYEEGDKYLEDPDLVKLREELGYSYTDMVVVSQEKLPNYLEKLKSFFTEHLHTDDEVRYFVDGSGYFDVRSGKDEWVRIAMSKGDMMSLPAGIYHRFTLDDTNYAKVIRLFVGEPIWTPHNRPCEDNEVRKTYASKYIPSAEEHEAEDKAEEGVPAKKAKVAPTEE